MAKFEKQLFNQKHSFGVTFLHAHAQYIYIVNAKYQKLWYKLISLYEHKQNPYLKANRKKKWLISRNCYFVKKHFLASNFFMQMFNESILCRQSIELFRHKLWYKLNSPHMHYLIHMSYKIAKL